MTPDPACPQPAPHRLLAARLEQDIYLGRLALGSRLKQIDLERRYRCSRIVLRQALDFAADRGLVTHEPGRGYRVATFDATLVRNLTETRAVVESAALRQTVGRHDAAGLARLEELAAVFRDACRPGGSERCAEANTAFHKALLAPCPNPVLVGLAFELRQRLPLSVSRAINTPERMRMLADQHFAMIAALRGGDAAALQALAWQHIALAAE